MSDGSIVVARHAGRERGTTASRTLAWVRTRRGKILLHAILFAALLIFLLPIIWTISASFKGKSELFQTLPTLFPVHPVIDNYIYVLTRIKRFPIFFANSVFVTTIGVSLIVLFSSLAGYAFGRIQFRGRDLIYYSLILQIFIPRAGGLMALYEVMRFLGLRNNLIGLGLLFAGGVGVPIFIMRQTFFNIPGEFEDAARIDGCSRMGAMWRIVLPLVRPGMAATGTLVAIEAWNDVLFALMITSSNEARTWPVGMKLLIGEFQLPWAQLTATAMMSVLPVLIAFALAGRKMVAGLTAGGVKE